MDEFTLEVRIVLARYGPATFTDLSHLLGCGYGEAENAVRRLRDEGQVRYCGDGRHELTRDGHLAVAPAKGRMEVPR